MGAKGTAVEQKLYAHLKEVLAQLTEELEKKVKVLQSDKYELQRQLEEIEHAETFYQQQMALLSGIEFINLWINHKMHKKTLFRTPTIVTDVQPEIRLEGRLQIVSDSHYKNLSIDPVSVERPRSVLAVEQREERANEFRTGLFSKLQASKYEGRQAPNLFANAAANTGGNVPTPMRLGMQDVARPKDRLSESMMKVARKVTSDVEKMVTIIDDQMKDASYKGSVSVESFKRSVFGRFSDTYKRLKTLIDPDQLSVVLSTAFKNSSIVTPPEGIVLYFNLPLSETWLPKPRKIFPNSDKPESFTIKWILTSPRLGN